MWETVGHDWSHFPNGATQAVAVKAVALNGVELWRHWLACILQSHAHAPATPMRNGIGLASASSTDQSVLGTGALEPIRNQNGICAARDVRSPVSAQANGIAANDVAWRFTEEVDAIS